MSKPVVCLLLVVVSSSVPCLHGRAANRVLGPVPRNLARSATIKASSEQQDSLPARNVADGHISGAGAGPGEIGGWAVIGDQAKGKADISFTWKQPVEVAEV